MTAGSGPAGPLEVSGLGLTSNRGCGWIALGAALLDCVRPGSTGSRRSAPSGLAPGNHLRSEVGSRSRTLVGKSAPSSWPGERPPCCAVSGRLPGLRGQKDASWPGWPRRVLREPSARPGDLYQATRARRWAPSLAQRPRPSHRRLRSPRLLPGHAAPRCLPV